VAVAQHPAKTTLRPAQTFAGVISMLRVNWHIAGVLLVFACAAFVVPTLTPIATTDDWGYTRSVEILLDEGRLTVFPVVAATAVFQILWGALFALLLGMTLGVMRVATLVMVAIGGLALYALLRELGVARSRSALGVAAYLFNPLAFILAYTFMTDPYFTSLLIAAAYLYVRGLRPGQTSGPVVLAASVVAACAFLTRQQGALIPLSVAAYLVFMGKLRLNRHGFALLVRVAAIPVVATAGYYVWLTYFNDVPDVQTGFVDEAKAEGLSGTWRLIRHLSLIECMYLGFFMLPIAVALLPGMRGVIRKMQTAGWLLVCAWTAIFAGGLASYWVLGRRMPYVPQFVGAGGLGPPDVRGARPRLFGELFFDWATVVCAVSVFIVVLVLFSHVRNQPATSLGAGLVLAITIGQIVGIVPPSFHYMNRGYSLDRYLLPLLPLGICLLLWAASDLHLFQPVAWAIVGVFALFSIAATRDYLVYMNAVWETAGDANAAGVASERLDAGAAWDGYHLYTLGLDQGITKARTRDGPWWTYFYGKATDSSYVVAGKPIPGYRLIWRRSYSSWLERDPTSVYLVRRYGTDGPP
jgi:hypothetical protein